ncbi:hypothetical protein ASG88_15415 [Nocardioides sp. Soil777]|uniref:hypothetical protein n=1 Tax=Nocardioides sp. Soil777 TaxID=1736409 RepID=UPI000702DB8C|nr:hypothetical protein [Nocardioides sp. Soil777]KRE99118.1 hypothetical protein ASG88_15415 [Nocardioides sp. Soil777]
MPARVLAVALFLGACLLVGSTVGEYLALAPVADTRGLGPSVVVPAALVSFDLTAAAVGLSAGLLSLLLVRWVARGR